MSPAFLSPLVMRTSFFRLGLLFSLGLLPLFPATIGTTRDGTLSGRVQNSATGAYLEGAVVTVEPGGASSLSERDGSFRFLGLAAGEYRVTVSYTGLESQTLQVRIAPGETTHREVAVTSPLYLMEPFTVAGEREGNALAITQQRHAPNVKNVISSDAFGNIADQNIGNLLIRLPGVTEEIDEGEIKAISVRGINSGMNAVTVDGTRSASVASVGGDMNRAFAIDRLPADFVERIEVTKALTPDMDGDSIGGAINLRTKSPLDRKGRHISYTGGTSWNVDRSTFRPIASFHYSDLLGADQRFGVLLTSSFNRTHKPRDTVYKNWQPTLDTQAPAYFWMSNLGEDSLKHERTGVGARVDYKLSGTHRIFLNTMFANYTDTLDRRHLQMSATPAQIRPGWTAAVTETLNQSVTLNQLHRNRSVDSVNVVLDGEKRFASSQLDYGANYSFSTNQEDRIQSLMQVNGVGFRFDRSKDNRFPMMRQISGTPYTDRTSHRNTAFNLGDYHDKDVIKAFHANWRKKVALDVPASLKLGVRYRGQERDRDQSRPYYIYTGSDGVVGTNPASDINDDNIAQFADNGYTYRSAHGHYDPIPAVDAQAMLRNLRANPSHFNFNVANSARDEVQYDGRITEEVSAAYLMADVRLGRLDVLAGIRTEETRVSSRGVKQEITAAERARRVAWVGLVTPDELRRRTLAEWGNLRYDKGNYTNVLPSVHFKYHPLTNLVSRLSYSTGIGRPNFSNLLQTTVVNNESLSIRAANPDLRPQTADNFDGTLEYYFEPAGHFSAGVFLKEIRNFIYASRGDVVGPGPNNGFEGLYEGYTVTMDTNGGFARVRGFELSYAQRFTFLPGVWRGLGISMNYTRINTKGQYTATGGVTTAAELAGFQPQSFNASLFYTYRKLEVQLKAIQRDEMLLAYNANPANRTYTYSRINYDVSLKYNWRPGLSFFMDIINVLDGSSQEGYIYIKDRYRYTMVYTPAIKTGLMGRF